MSPALAELQREWYQKATKGESRVLGFKFRDIESGRDLGNGYWTFGGSTNRHVHVQLENQVQLDRQDLETTLADHPEAEFWRLVGQAANELPMNYPRRAFILSAAETGNVEGSGKKHGIAHPTQSWRIWWRFLDKAGLG